MLADRSSGEVSELPPLDGFDRWFEFKEFARVVLSALDDANPAEPAVAIFKASDEFTNADSDVSAGVSDADANEVIELSPVGGNRLLLGDSNCR